MNKRRRYKAKAKRRYAQLVQQGKITMRDWTVETVFREDYITAAALDAITAARYFQPVVQLDSATLS